MENFLETLTDNLTPEKSEEIMKNMVVGSAGPNSQAGAEFRQVRLGKGGVVRQEGPKNHKRPLLGSLRDCQRGSPSGANGHALWLCCRKCMIRIVAYVPTWGSTGAHRSAGPLSSDTNKKTKDSKEGDFAPEQLKTKAIALDAAEESALRKLEQVRKQRQNMQQGARVTSQGKGYNVSEDVKKAQRGEDTRMTDGKRMNPKTPEQREKEEYEITSSDGWQKVSP